MRAHAGAVYGVDFCADSRFVISAGEDATARLWSLEVRCKRCSRLAADLLLRKDSPVLCTSLACGRHSVLCCSAAAPSRFTLATRSPCGPWQARPLDHTSQQAH